MAEITIKDITTGDVKGSGVFDKLMASAQVRLDQEWHKNRIRGPDYTKVYLGQLEAVLQNSIMFLLGRQEADAVAELTKEKTLTEAEARKLVVAQINKMKAEERLIEGQIEKMKQEILVMKGEVSMIPDKIALLKAQVDKMQKEGELIDGQIKKMVQEILLMERQAEKMLSEIELMKGQVKKMDFEIKLMEAQADKTREEVLLIKGQVEKMKSEIKVMEQQVLESIQKVETMRASVWAERAKTNTDPNIFVEPYNPSKLTKVTGLVGAQIQKIDDEGKLLEAKVVTENAQTNDLIDTPERMVTGVIGKQKALYQKQTDGFDRDAEQKLSKILVDTWTIRRTTDEDTTAENTGLEDDQINNVLDMAKRGIGVDENGLGGGGGGNSGGIAGVTVDILAITDVLEDCLATFESHVTIDNLSTVSIKSWEWWSPEGRPDHRAAMGPTDPERFLFSTGFWEPGENPITLEIVLADSDVDSDYNNHHIRFTKNFHATATDGGCMGGTRPLAKAKIEDATAVAYRLAHPDNYDYQAGFDSSDHTVQAHIPPGDNGTDVTASTEGHKPSS